MKNNNKIGKSHLKNHLCGWQPLWLSKYCENQAKMNTKADHKQQPKSSVKGSEKKMKNGNKCKRE